MPKPLNSRNTSRYPSQADVAFQPQAICSHRTQSITQLFQHTAPANRSFPSLTLQKSSQVQAGLSPKCRARQAACCFISKYPQFDDSINVMSWNLRMLANGDPILTQEPLALSHTIPIAVQSPASNFKAPERFHYREGWDRSLVARCGEPDAHAFVCLPLHITSLWLSAWHCRWGEESCKLNKMLSLLSRHSHRSWFPNSQLFRT
jgi:hypothetical protein